MRISADPAVASRRELRQIRNQLATTIEQLFRFITAHPFFQQPEVLRVFSHRREGNLVCPERSLDRDAVHHLWPRPSFWRSQNNHGPYRPTRKTSAARLALNLVDLIVRFVQRRRELLMNFGRIVTGNQERRVPMPVEQADQFIFRNSRVDSRAGDLIAVQMQDWKDCAIADGIQKLVTFPAAFQRARFRLPISDDA